MKSSFECVICYHRQALRTARITTKDEKLITKVLKSTMEYFMNTPNWKRTPLDFGYDLYPLFYKVLGVDDPYKKLKEKSNELALSIYPWTKESIEQSSDPLLTAIRFSIAGNIADYGAMDEFDLEDQIKTSLNKDFAINNYSIFKREIKRAKTVLYFLDNAGEAVFDKVFIETLFSLYPNLSKISVVAKRYPLINDMTFEDAYALGFAEDERVEVLTTWKDVNWKEKLKEYDVVISKGQGNYEGLSVYPNIFFLLVAKCEVVANDIGVNIGDFIFKLSDDKGAL
ncbi:MAG TPA: DUF89 family protein [Candidatus Atribacteria bacterium]|nr:DUF89 family protein [Candidatus Atribacteria bacterium]